MNLNISRDLWHRKWMKNLRIMHKKDSFLRDVANAESALERGEVFVRLSGIMKEYFEGMKWPLKILRSQL